MIIEIKKEIKILYIDNKINKNITYFIFLRNTSALYILDFNIIIRVHLLLAGLLNFVTFIKF